MIDNDILWFTLTLIGYATVFHRSGADVCLWKRKPLKSLLKPWSVQLDFFFVGKHIVLRKMCTLCFCWLPRIEVLGFCKILKVIYSNSNLVVTAFIIIRIPRTLVLKKCYTTPKPTFAGKFRFPKGLSYNKNATAANYVLQITQHVILSP